jgi:hypothetical protein
MTTFFPSMVTITELRRRASRGSSELHIGQGQAMSGTPCEVPVPKKVMIMWAKLLQAKHLNDIADALSFRNT